MASIPVNPLLGFGLLAGGIVVATLASDARLALLALLAQYAGSAFVAASASAQSVAWLHIAVGGMATAMLYLGLRARPSPHAGGVPALGLPFRAAALLMALAACVLLALRWPLPYAGDGVSLACFALVGGFVAQMGLFREPERVGVATLSLLNAAVVYVQAAGGGPLLTALLLCGHLLTGLASGHLAAVWGASEGEG